MCLFDWLVGWLIGWLAGLFARLDVVWCDLAWYDVIWSIDWAHESEDPSLKSLERILGQSRNGLSVQLFECIRSPQLATLWMHSLRCCCFCSPRIDTHATYFVHMIQTHGPFWVVLQRVTRNSWGEDWGESGHIRLLRFDDHDHEKSGYCGTDYHPQEGVACDGETSPVPVCGMCTSAWWHAQSVDLFVARSFEWILQTRGW